jgi:uncharacterized protein YeaO (DUF488 family)
MNLDSKCKSSKRDLRLYIHKDVYNRLDEISFIENKNKDTIIEKMILNYTPIPAVIAEGEFRCVYANEVKILMRLNPFATVVSVYRNALIGRSREDMKELKDGKISWNEFKRRYVERLNKPDAIKEITRLRKLKTTQDIYITSFERIEEFSLRKLFVDYVNGKLIWN